MLRHCGNIGSEGAVQKVLLPPEAVAWRGARADGVRAVLDTLRERVADSLWTLPREGDGQGEKGEGEGEGGGGGGGSPPWRGQDSPLGLLHRRPPVQYRIPIQTQENEGRARACEDSGE